MPAALATPAGSCSRRSRGTSSSSSSRSPSSPRTSFGEVVGYSDIAYTWTLDNYRYLWDDFVGDLHLYRDIFLETLKLSVIGTLSTLVIGFPLAYYIARYAKHKTLLLLLVIVPFWTSFLIRAYAWLIILDPEFPVFRALGLSGFMERHEILFTPNAIYIGVAYNYLPLMVLPLYAALERIDWSLVDAAQDLGDPPWRAFRRITFPLALPGDPGGLAARLHPADGRVHHPGRSSAATRRSTPATSSPSSSSSPVTGRSAPRSRWSSSER